MSLPTLYRSTLRQFVANSIHPRAKRSPTIPAHLRLMFDSARSVQAGTPEAAAFARQVEDMVVFLKAHRLHKALVERYNPTSGMTNDERSRKSAKMVGLDFPEAFDPNETPTMEGAEAKKRAVRAKEAADQGLGSLQSIG